MSMMPSEIASLLIPLESNNLLVPNSCVAEIVPYVLPEKSENQNAWLLGNVVWRDLDLPCISFEHLADNKSLSTKVERIAIFNTVSEAFDKRFYGVAINGIPRLARVVEQEIVEELIEQAAFEKLNVQVNGEKCIIPDLEAIEKLLSTSDLS
jgi:chemosensory pili system protein ChpC